MNLTKATSSKGVGARAAPRVPRSRAGARAGAGARAWAGMVRVRPHPHQQSHSRLPRCQAIKTWEYMQPELYKMLESGDFVTSMPEDVLDQVEAGKAILVDVRLQPDYEEVHATKARSIPLFQRIQTVSVENAIKSVFYFINGVKGTEENPDFVSDVKKTFAELKDGQRLYFMCDAGGTCEAVPGFLLGKKSRSLQAVFKAVDEAQVPVKSVGHVKGGLRQWAGGSQLGLEGEDVDAW
eukprot:CAMPEP_0197483034 /NCGR_PEP_ID=MMETSP1309-20131121/56675_1 /TAXON_ID=464262 /ORGANISM="Genus nov. species nov., Strain RCC998" /LENGTH=237 /DNA_ID=CAMNT_0043025619 /DNA_START=85 /DNA_END=795 /DNA_ORIENTATION=-